MKKLISAAFIFVLIISLGFSCSSSGKNAVSASGNSSVTGNIMIYTSMYDEIVRDMEKILFNRFPNCKIEFSFGGTGTLQAKIDSEIGSGSIGCDIIMVAEPAYSLELKGKGLLHPFKYKEASALAFDYDPDGYWYPVRISSMTLAFNPEKNVKNTLPNSFYDFAHDSKVKGAISMSNPIISGTTLAAAAALKDKYGYEYFTALGKQNVVLETASVSLAKLETGERKVVMVLEESVLNKRETEKSKIEVIYPSDGAVVIPSTIMIVNDKFNKNKNIPAAEAIADWFLGTEGQDAIVSAWMHSVRANFDKQPYDAISSATIQTRGKMLPVNWENVLHQGDEIRDKFEEQVIYGR